MIKKRYLSSIALFLAVIIFAGCSSGGNYSSAPDASYYANAENEVMFDMSGGDVFNTEEYSEITENVFKSAANNPLSTFSIDVDTASYANVRRMINSGQLPGAGAVRTEEFLNYFRYDYEQPSGDDPVAITTEIMDCPWNTDTKLMLIGVQAEEIDKTQLKSSNFVFLIDVSGSMDSADKLPLVKAAFGYLLENLSANDRISIVTYASSDRVILKGATGDEKAEISAAINELEAGGSTAGSAGIQTAYEIAEEYFIEGGNNRVILATDGDLNVGITSEDDLKKLIEEKRDSGINLSVLGFGTGNIKDNKMETLADNGNGVYHYIDSRNEARKVLIEEMGGNLFTVANDVKIQVEFNPSTVKGYRLIGYENRLLNSEDFADDTKDAGEMGAGTRCTVLYEIALTGSAQEINETELQYQTTEDTGSTDWLTISLRYKNNGETESKLMSVSVDETKLTSSPSENLLFAANVASFGMLLRGSEFSGTSTYDGIIASLSALGSVKNDVLKSELITLVQKAAELARGQG